MHCHEETRVLPYAPRQLFDLVADVARYPEFLPWCLAARITRREGNVVYADVVVGTRIFRETFTSKVTLDDGGGREGSADHPLRIDVEYVKGPMREMENHWEFRPHPEGCELHFRVAFAFRSRLLDAVMGRVFTEAVHRMVRAFETRAGALHGAAG
jgi:coenzyme Q-binding protein COQ10